MAGDAGLGAVHLTIIFTYARYFANYSTKLLSWMVRRNGQTLHLNCLMPKYHILRSYSDKPDSQVADFALHVATALTGNAAFTTPTILPATLTTQANSFNTAIALADNGTPAQTADKNAKRVIVLASLDTLATYVELTAGNDQTKMLSSGFDLASTSRATAVPGDTFIRAVINTSTTRLGLDIPSAENAWCYLVEYTGVSQSQAHLAVFTSLDGIELTGLTPGTMYSLRVQVMGSKNQVSKWSDPVQHMAT